MSYLTTPKLDEFSKAVISFWFRVPQASLDAAQKESDDFHDADDPGDPPPLLGLVPLVVFGKEGTSNSSAEQTVQTDPQKTSTTRTTCVEHADGGTLTGDLLTGLIFKGTTWPECDTSTNTRAYYRSTVNYSLKPGKPTNPSFIAIDGSGKLHINFESTQVGKVTLPYGIASVTSEYYTQPIINECWTFQFLNGCVDFTQTTNCGPGFPGLLLSAFIAVAWKLSTAVPDNYIDTGSSPREEHKSTSTFGSVPGDMGTGAIGFTVPNSLAGDAWHHVLVSVDMTGGSASTGLAVGETMEDPASHYSATSTLYVAVDGVNYPTGGDTFPDTNKVVTASASAIAFTGQASSWDGNIQTPEGPVPSYSLTDMSVPAAEVGIPATGKYADHIRKVEMAEFLFFTDVVLDTSKEENLRYFISGRGPTNSSPLTIPYFKYAIGDPPTWEPGADWPAFAPPLFDPSAWPTMIKALGGAADIDFTKCSWNWQMGRNLGTLKGKVEKTGKIKEYFPDPELEAADGSGG